MLKELLFKLIFIFIIINIVYNDGLKAQIYSDSLNLSKNNNNYFAVSDEVNNAIVSLANIQIKVNKTMLCFINNLSTKKTWHKITGISVFSTSGVIFLDLLSSAINNYFFNNKVGVIGKLFKSKQDLVVDSLIVLFFISLFFHLYFSLDDANSFFFINYKQNINQENFNTLAMLLYEVDFINNKDINSMPFHTAEILINDLALLEYISQFEKDLSTKEGMSLSKLIQELNNKGFNIENLDATMLEALDECLQKN